MIVELIATGSELLLGHVQDTHLRFLAAGILPLGLRFSREVIVPDGPAIGAALQESFRSADILFVSGGLGPTTDDLTREITAELLGTPLREDPVILAEITQRFAVRGLTMSPRVALQAMRPAEALVLPNHHGTAPGLYFPPLPISLPGARGGRSPHLFLLPGPPRELQPMFRESVFPELQQLARPDSPLRVKVWKVSLLGESHVEELVGERLMALGGELGYCARPGEVDVRLIGSAAQIASAEKIIHEKLAPYIISDDLTSLGSAVVRLLSERGQTVATAESCTGGALADRITDVPGASRVFTEGFVTYANAAKVRSLGVDPLLIERHGAVSLEVAAAMAAGALSKSGADYALSTTGIAGPGGGSLEKPVGTVCLGLSARDRPPVTQIHHFPTDRETFKALATQTALDLLRAALLA